VFAAHNTAVAAVLLPWHLHVPSFCWGGLYAVLLVQGQTPKVSAAGIHHGSLITTADVEAVTAPINFQQADPALDKQIGPDLYKQVRPAVSSLFLYSSVVLMYLQSTRMRPAGMKWSSHAASAADVPHTA
jgi:hypothetical protein